KKNDPPKIRSTASRHRQILPHRGRNANPRGPTQEVCRSKVRLDRYNPATTPASSTACPTRTRYNILALLTMISIITYVDRVNISVAARQMMPALGLTPVQMGYVFSAFVLGYALFQIPGGWLGDRWGVRKVLAAAVLWWSFFTACPAVR